MHKILLTFLGLSSFSMMMAQVEGSSFSSTGRGGATTFATDYQCTGINPANLGWHGKFEEKRFTMGYTEMAFSVHSMAFTKSELRSEFKTMITNKSSKSFTMDEKKNAAKDFANNPLVINVDVGSFGFSFANDKFGGIAFRVNDNFNWYSKFNDEVSEIMFLGKNAKYFDSLTYVNNGDTSMIANYSNMSQDSLANVLSGFSSAPQMLSKLLDGSKVGMSWTREYNLSYGRVIVQAEDKFAIYGGVGAKFYQGMAYMNLSAENGELTAFSAMSPAFGINYGEAAQLNPSTDSAVTKFPKPVGMGFGFDFGANILIGKKLKIGMAVVNVGSMTWTGNVYTVKDTTLINTQSGGLESYNVMDNMDKMIGENGLFEWGGEKEIVTKLPGTFRMGASFAFNDKLELGIDALMPMSDNVGPGSLDKAIIGLGGDFSPVPWLRLQAGFVTGGNYDFSIPVGLLFVKGGGSWEGGIASRDIVTFFTQNGPTLSFSTGFMRFRF